MVNDVFDDVFVVVMETSFPDCDKYEDFPEYFEKEILAVCDSVEEAKKHVKLYSDQMVEEIDKYAKDWTKQVTYDGKMVEVIDGKKHSKRYLFGIKKYRMNEINTQMES